MDVPPWEMRPSSVGPSQAAGQTPQFMGRKERGACCPRKHQPPPHPTPSRRSLGALLTAATPAVSRDTDEGGSWVGCEESWRRPPVWGCLSRVPRVLGFRKNPEKMKVPETSGFLATFLFTRNDVQIECISQPPSLVLSCGRPSASGHRRRPRVRETFAVLAACPQDCDPGF